MNIFRRCLMTVLAIMIGLAVGNGLLWLYVEFAGPFYPDSTQQQCNFDHFLVGNLVVIISSVISFTGVAANVVVWRSNRKSVPVRRPIHPVARLPAL